MISKKVTIREEIMKLCEVGAQRGQNGDLKTLKTQGGVAKSATCLKSENQRGTLEFCYPSNGFLMQNGGCRGACLGAGAQIMENVTNSALKACSKLILRRSEEKSHGKIIKKPLEGWKNPKVCFF